MIVADTSAWIDYVNGIIAPHTDLLDFELMNNRIITGDIIITEFLQGFKNDGEYVKAKEIMESLVYFDFVGHQNAYKAVENYRMLRRRGITIRKTIDVFIATFCIENDFPLIHNDRDFDPIEEIMGLQVRRLDLQLSIP
ncbi:MAG: PIN domain nuclease [Spirochaetales bacterium]|nr:PIN domain nuclease [Spirochaetales bacterium]